MKKILLFASFLISSVGFAQVQDTVFLKDGSYLTGKVTEIAKHDIKYKKAENPEGPTYVLSRKEVDSIHYPNGDRDIFHSGPPPRYNNYNDDAYANDDRPCRRSRHCDVEVEDVIIPAIEIGARVLFWSLVLCPRVIFR
jgi:hypothetical protein